LIEKTVCDIDEDILNCIVSIMINLCADTYNPIIYKYLDADFCFFCSILKDISIIYICNFLAKYIWKSRS